ncbi:MAG: hypothetical protein RLZZ383_129 [Pseudomonadota bacterium]
MDAKDLALRVTEGQRAALARLVTLVESRRPQDRRVAAEVAQRLRGGSVAHRVGVSGPPGAGKSTLIEALGVALCQAGQRVAVLAVDPSSRRTGGALLGDQARMTRLSQWPSAFVRPTASGSTLGGVHARTADVVEVLEAVGFDWVLVETVGVGQSEVEVLHAVDTLLLLALPGSGDELQGMKRGIVEGTDVLWVNKADGATESLAHLAQRQWLAALQLHRPRQPGWQVPVLCGSALANKGISELIEALRTHRAHLETTGAWGVVRRAQRRDRVAAGVRDGVWSLFLRDPSHAAAVEAALLAADDEHVPVEVLVSSVLSAD